MSDAKDENQQPERIGHFRVVGSIGEGGMGAVFVGRDDTLGRDVALKVIHPGHRLDPLRKARLLREAQILSQLSHPGVCQLFDFVESPDGDCLVLELVEGESLRSAMDRGLDRAQALDIVEQLLDVLAAVHGRGVIHRDLKPDNVMLGPDGRVKVLDFGLAREERLNDGDDAHENTGDGDTVEHLDEASDDRGLTTTGSILGTVGYMSPEQARGEPATAASDMYSLGLMMQELLTGSSPIRRDLPRQVRLQRAMWGESDPVEGLPPDLTAFVNRLKELEPAARPAAVDAAAKLAEIRNRPRQRRIRIAVAAGVAVLAVFAAGMTVQFLRAEREARRAEREAETARQISDFLESVFDVADPNASPDHEVTARELLDRASERIDTELAEQPVVQARMMDTIGSVYATLGLYDDSIRLGRKALDLRRQLHTGDHPETATSLDQLGIVLLVTSRLDDAAPLLNDGLAMRRRLFGDNHPDVATSLNNVARLASMEGDYEQAETLIRDVIAIRRELLGTEHSDYLDALNNLAYLEWIRGDYATAEPLFRELLETRRRVIGNENPSVAKAMHNLASSLKGLGRFDEAEELYLESLEMNKKMYGSEHPNIASTLNNLASIKQDTGKLDEAIAFYQETVSMKSSLFGPESMAVAKSRERFAGCLEEAGDFLAALDQCLQAQAIYRDELGDEHAKTVAIASRMGALLRALGRNGEAEAVYRDVMEKRRSLLGDHHVDVARSQFDLASALSDQGRFQEAEPLFRQALATFDQTLPTDDPELARTRESLHVVLEKLNRSAESAEIEASVHGG